MLHASCGTTRLVTTTRYWSGSAWLPLNVLFYYFSAIATLHESPISCTLALQHPWWILRKWNWWHTLRHVCYCTLQNLNSSRPVSCTEVINRDAIGIIGPCSLKLACHAQLSCGSKLFFSVERSMGHRNKNATSRSCRLQVGHLHICMIPAYFRYLSCGDLGTLMRELIVTRCRGQSLLHLFLF
jgi:hypothetical protein